MSELERDGCTTGSMEVILPPDFLRREEGCNDSDNSPREADGAASGLNHPDLSMENKIQMKLIGNSDGFSFKVPPLPTPSFVSGGNDVTNSDRLKEGTEACKLVRAKREGEFKVPLFSSKSPPPSLDAKASSSVVADSTFKVPPLPLRFLSKSESGHSGSQNQTTKSGTLDASPARDISRNFTNEMAHNRGGLNSISNSDLASENGEATTSSEVLTGHDDFLSKDDQHLENSTSNKTTQVSVNAADPAYVKPSWSSVPGHLYKLEVLKEGVSLGTEDISRKAAYMFGRSDRSDFVLEHPSISRFHAVLQYSATGKAFIYDIGSTHGTFINKRQVQIKSYVALNVGDIVKFGLSSRLYHFQGPDEFKPEEGLSKSERHAVRMLELAQDEADREQSLSRARKNAAAADGATWGMQEDAVEADEEDGEEITWQNFKGELTEKQHKTLEKVHKRQEKLANLKKENDAIQAKEISQGGLTQGQQTQMARNEQRMAQLADELESMEETLNESIREAIVGRTGVRKHGRKSEQHDDDEDDPSDDDFYDRTIKQKKKADETGQVVETAETILVKKSFVVKEIEAVRELLEHEKKQGLQPVALKNEPHAVDSLETFMTTISASIVQDRADRLQKEMCRLEKELERFERLLKIADPMGDALKKWERSRSLDSSITSIADLVEKNDQIVFPKKEDVMERTSVLNQAGVGNARHDVDAENQDSNEKPVDLRPLDPPIRLGAPPSKTEETPLISYGREPEGAAAFIDYKGRQKEKTLEGNLKVATRDSSGQEAQVSDVNDASSSVALLLKHKRGINGDENCDGTNGTSESGKQPLKKKKIYGPAKPSYLTNTEDEENWVPPAGQTGDGRTALNDKYGY